VPGPAPPQLCRKPSDRDFEPGRYPLDDGDEGGAVRLACGEEPEHEKDGTAAERRYLMIDWPTDKVKTLSPYMNTPLSLSRLITLKSWAKVSPTPTV